MTQPGPNFGRTGLAHRAGPILPPLASTKASFDIIALEVIGSTFYVDTIRGKPRTWFASVIVAPVFQSVFYCRDV